MPRDHLYDFTMYILCAMLIIGLICNFLVKPVNAKWYMSEDEVAKLQAASAKSTAGTASGSFGIGKGGLDWKAAVVLGLRRHTAGLGRVDNTQIRCGAVSIADTRPARAAASAAVRVLRDGEHFPRPRHKPLDESRRSA